ncbi:imidazole glycerol phosphate synthase subunit HisH 1 [archaeon BMS3Abin16]|nr:imidazole glycerol phosphate synthase subunit HisH 1 [archaeon BMS3Abin16]
MITIIDLGLGNVNSVMRALNYLKVSNRVSSEISDLEEAEKLIFPGVGNFFEASKRLEINGMKQAIREQVLELGKPILGICLGMQLLANEGEEGGISKGLGLIDGRVVRMSSEKVGLRLPHIGWNDVSHRNLKLFSGIDENACFYFVHSYALELEGDVEHSLSNYGTDFVAAVKKDNIIGTQFHPEKSQKDGLKLLTNFVNGVF